MATTTRFAELAADLLAQVREDCERAGADRKVEAQTVARCFITCALEDPEWARWHCDTQLRDEREEWARWFIAQTRPIGEGQG